MSRENGAEKGVDSAHQPVINFFSFVFSYLAEWASPPRVSSHRFVTSRPTEGKGNST